MPSLRSGVALSKGVTDHAREKFLIFFFHQRGERAA
jgi:hypothetical protein